MLHTLHESDQQLVENDLRELRDFCGSIKTVSLCHSQNLSTRERCPRALSPPGGDSNIKKDGDARQEF